MTDMLARDLDDLIGTRWVVILFTPRDPFDPKNGSAWGPFDQYDDAREFIEGMDNASIFPLYQAS